MSCLFFFIDTPTTEIYTLSLHDALPIFGTPLPDSLVGTPGNDKILGLGGDDRIDGRQGNDCLYGGFDNDLRSEEHTSELQSHVNLVCRLLLEKKKKKI